MSDLAEALMTEFAESTGVSGRATPRRYLWTDAFAVCNFLGLYRRTGKDRYVELARELVAQVHHILGRHRPDDPRHGWISGLSEEEGEAHPTFGGLRIGKALNERGPHQPADARLEWDQDGQYFHYVTKWMHALYRMGQETGERSYPRWAVELAATAHRAFTYEVFPGQPKRMAWKMSIDLRRPLVSSMGQHDPLDGLIACLELQTDASFEPGTSADLAPAIADFDEMCERAEWLTDDPLGIGGLLDAAARLAQIVFDRGIERQRLLRRLLADAGRSLGAFAHASPLSGSAERRLAFRELGLSIGIHGLEQVRALVKSDHELATVVDRPLEHRFVAQQIEAFWSDPVHRLGHAWQEHLDINTVMLATSLAPAGYLEL
jgi:hypothetical protein